MRKRFLFIGLLVLYSGTFGGADPIPLTILFQGDLHSYLLADANGNGGVARAAGYFKKVRQEVQNVLVLNSGDMVTGTPVSLMYKGDPVFHVANFFGLDAAILGNHEFDHGWQKIERYREIAQFPILCGNVYVTGADGQQHLLADAGYEIFKKGALRIGVLSVVSEETVSITKKQDTQGIAFVKALDTLQRMVKEVSDRCDFVIALTHVGIKKDETIAEKVQGLDLIVGGHSHTRMEKEQRVNGIPIVHSGAKGYSVGRIDLTVDSETHQIGEFQFQLLPVNADLAPEDEETAREVKNWEDKVSELVDRPLGTSKRSFSQQELILLANAAFLEATGADYAYQNSGGTRSTLKKGDFPYRDIWNIFPFENTLVTASLKGKEIPKDFYGWKSIDPQKSYKLVTNSFVRDQIERYLPSLKNVSWEETGIDLRDAVIRYIEKRKIVDHVSLTQ